MRRPSIAGAEPDAVGRRPGMTTPLDLAAPLQASATQPGRLGDPHHQSAVRCVAVVPGDPDAAEAVLSISRTSPRPQAVAVALFHHLHQQRFFIDIGVSLARILVSYGLAVIVGIPVGVLIGRIRMARNRDLALDRGVAADPRRRVDSPRDSAVADRGILDRLHHLPGRAVSDRAEHRDRRREHAGTVAARGAVVGSAARRRSSATW